LFTGREYDPETGWYYYRTRYLDPVAGRFTTRDTIGIWGDAANLGNGYAYAANNPWSSVDPMGQQCQCDDDEKAKWKEAGKQLLDFAKDLLKQVGIDIAEIAGGLAHWWEDLPIVQRVGFIAGGAITAGVVANNADKFNIEEVPLPISPITMEHFNLTLYPTATLMPNFTPKDPYYIVGLEIEWKPIQESNFKLSMDAYCNYERMRNSYNSGPDRSVSSGVGLHGKYNGSGPSKSLWEFVVDLTCVLKQDHPAGSEKTRLVDDSVWLGLFIKF
jgi:RHS repeat-associated protein